MWERAPGSAAQLLVSVRDWRHSPPKWSPDGTRVAYARTRTGPGKPERAIVLLNVDSRREEVVTTTGRDLVPADWSADGQRLLTSCKLAPTDRPGTCVMPIGETGREPNIERLAMDPRTSLFQQRYSPNQNWISFMAVPTDDRSTATLYVMSASGGPWTAVTDGKWYDDKPRWAPDGRTLYFISNRDGHPNVWGRHMDPATGRPQGEIFRVTKFGTDRHMLFPSVSRMTLSVSANRILLPMSEAASQIWVLDNIDR
jgi:Tol biopolymer transport system component